MKDEDKTREQLIRELEELRQTRVLLEGLFEFAPDAIVVVNREGYVVQINKQAEKMFGYSKDEVLGKPVEIFVPERFRELHVKQVNSYMSLPRIRFLGTGLELYGRRKDGSEFPVDIMLGPLQTTEGIFVLSIVRDTTEHRRMDEEIRLLLTLTQAINESKDMNAAIETSLRKVCEATGWNYGEAWIPNQDRTALFCGSVWYYSNGALEKFRRLSENYTFPPGTGLPGRVWSSKQPEWIPDVSISPEIVFPRAMAAREAGFKAGLGVPIIANNQVLAVLVFFMFESRKKDQQLVDIVSAVATQLGSLIQRKQMEEMLRASEIKYRSIFENAVEGIFQTSVEGRILAVNPACVRILGYDSSEELMASVTDARKLYVEPGRRLQLVRTIRAHGIMTNFEAQIRRKDGGKIWVLINAHALYDSSGNVVGLEGMVTDITNRKRAERNFQMLIDSAPDAIVAVDSNYNILLINTQTESIFGYKREELLGKSYDILIPGRFREKHAGYCAGYFEKPTTKKMALHLGAIAMRKNGSEFPVEINMSPIETEEGIIVVTDIRDSSGRTCVPK